MLKYLLDPTYVQIGLLVLAVVTPLLAWALKRARPDVYTRRMAIAIGAAGPFALLYWQFHQLVLGVLGFDRIISAVVVIGVAALVGLAAGYWVGRENRG